jgi:uncharacterized repeat protein (TIGR03803 family)
MTLNPRTLKDFIFSCPGWLLLAAAQLCFVWACPAAGFTFTTVASFAGTNGAFPQARLVQGADGSFYGTTAAGGGDTSQGTVFKMTPSGALTTLVSFTSPYSNGANPQAELLPCNDGSFYGTTAGGGSYSHGTIFRINPAGALASLYSFYGTFDGAQPNAGLVQPSDGNFYSTTPAGGYYLNGTVFQVTSNGALNSLYSFSDGDGVYPYSGLVRGNDGNLYGTTEYGGAGYDGTDFSGDGTIFQITTNGILTTLVAFTGDNGAHPYAGLLQAADGNFYGTTYEGPATTNGTVFKMTPAGALKTLFVFNGTNGALPSASLVQGRDGNLYGTTPYGAIGYDGSPSSGSGTVFMITTNGVLTTLVSFNGANGSSPLAGLFQSTNGDLYGTTFGGGDYDDGTVFRLSVAPAPPPVFQTVSQSGTNISLTWTAVAGRTYQVQASTNFSNTSWNNKGSSVTASNSTASWSEGVGPDPERFYRVVLLP